MSKHANWWFDELGVNNLAGVPGDDSNRVILPDATIVQFLLGNPQARIDFQALVPTMLPEEQDRLNGIVARNPRVLQKDPDPDPQVVDDQFQNTLNRQGVFYDPNRRRR